MKQCTWFIRKRMNQLSTDTVVCSLSIHCSIYLLSWSCSLRYNKPNEPFVITGRMVPCWVMIMPTDIGDGNLTVAKSKAVWKQRVTEDVRETILSLEQTSLVSYTGRYVSGKDGQGTVMAVMVGVVLAVGGGGGACGWSVGNTL